MENKMNIAELLKDCPKGMELDCTVFTGLEFDHIDENNGTYPIICRVKTDFGGYNIHTFNKYGCYSMAVYSKCVIFPKGKTTWEGFIPPCKFKNGDIISNGDYVAIFYKIGTPCCCKSPNVVYYHCYYSQKWHNFKKELDFGIGISTEFKYATEEEKETLFKEIKANGYHWNPETKTLEKLIEPKFKVGDVIKTVFKPYKYTVIKITNTHYTLEEVDDKFIYVQSISNQYNWELVPNKFDINTLVPFESRVLVRDSDYGEWKGSFWSHLRQGADIKYDTIRGVYRQCIPYNDDTKHLLGKTNDCSEFYKNWK